MSVSRKRVLKESGDVDACIAAAQTRQATGAETAGYIEEMICEMEALARSRGLDRLGNLLHSAHQEAHLKAQER